MFLARKDTRPVPCVRVYLQRTMCGLYTHVLGSFPTLYVQTCTYWEICKEDTSTFACVCLTNGHDPGTPSLDNSLWPRNKGRAAAASSGESAPTWSTKLTMTGRNDRSLAAIARYAAKVYIHLYDPVRPCHDWVSEVKKEVG